METSLNYSNLQDLSGPTSSSLGRISLERRLALKFKADLVTQLNEFNFKTTSSLINALASLFSNFNSLFGGFNSLFA